MRLFGIPVRVRPAFFVMAVLLGLGLGDFGRLAEWVAVVLVSILLHELGHAFAGRAFGLEPSIELVALGGLTRWTGARGALSPGRSLVVSLAGPAVGLAVGVVVLVAFPLLGLTDEGSPFRDLYVDLLWVNLGWSVFNLLPILPLDGGQAFAALVRLVTPSRVPPLCVSLLLVAALGLAAVTMGQVYMALLLVWIGFSNGRDLAEALRAGRDTPHREALDAWLRAHAPGDTSVPERVASTARGDALRAEAVHHLAWEHVRAGRVAEAKAAMGRFPQGWAASPVLVAAIAEVQSDAATAEVVLRRASEANPTGTATAAFVGLLLRHGRMADAAGVALDPRTALGPDVLAGIQSAAFEAGDFDASARAGERLFATTKMPLAAFNVACARARQGRTDDAVAWLRSACGAGFRDLAAHDDDPDLAAVRALPEWPQVRAELTAGPPCP